MLSGDITIALAEVDLVYARISLLLSAADRVLPGEDTEFIERHRARTARAPPGRAPATPVILCVYALTAPSSSRVIGTGIAGERLRAITAGRITALAGELRRAPKPTMRNLRRYAAVIDALAERAPAILPARFGTCMTDLDELTFVLRSRQDALRRRLRAVRGRAQMTIRVVLGSDSGQYGAASQTRVTAVRESDSIPRQHQGSNICNIAQGPRHAAREIPGFEPIRTAAKRWLKDERIEKRSGVATVNHLIPRSSASAYRAAVERAGARAGVRLVVSGPHPPYAFADNW